MRQAEEPTVVQRGGDAEPPGAVGADEHAGGAVRPRGGADGPAACAADAATPLRDGVAGTLLRACIYRGEFAPAYGLERKVEGVGAQNLRYIQDLTGAHVAFECEDRLLAATADTDVVIAKALCLTRELVETVQAAYKRWCAGRRCRRPT